MNNYYELLNLKPIHSEIELFKAYLKVTKLALTNKDIDLFRKARQGFEVCRYEKSLLAYHRIFKKYILKMELNYPAKKEEELRKIYTEKEIIANRYVDSFNNKLPSYSSHLTTIILKLITLDIVSILEFRSGLVFFSSGLFCIINFPNGTSYIGGLFLLLVGFFSARFNFKNYINKG
jgi:hypothetical protein